MKFERVVWIVIILLIAGFFVFRESKNKQAQKSLTTIIEVMNDSITLHQTKEGNWEAERRSYNLTVDELKDYNEEIGIDNKKLKKRIRTLNSLVSVLQGKIEADGSGEVTLVKDTVYLSDGTQFIGHSFDWNNEYLFLNGTLNDNYDMKFNYSYHSKFEVTTYWKKNGVFKGKDLVVNFAMTDPNAIASELNSVAIKPDPPKFYETTWFKVGTGFLGGLFISGLAN